MRLRSMMLLALVTSLAAWLVTATVQAQANSNNATIAMMDNCSDSDAAYDPFGGCPEGAPFPGSNSYGGDVSAAEFFALFSSPLAPGGQVIGHPSWRNEPSYVSVNSGQRVRITNRGGRAHTFTEVASFGGGFVGLINGALQPAPECQNPDVLTFVPYGGSQTISGLSPGLHTFQCCIHPWMRAAIRIN